MDFRKNLAVIPRDEFPGLAAWLDEHDGQVFRLKAIRGDAYFQALGQEGDACRVPINITSKSPGELRLISNFAATPFVLDGQTYGSVEAFWQGLKFPDDADRRLIAPLSGAKAKDAGFRAPNADVLIYGDEMIRIGTFEHWALMERATMAKFEQNERARRALLSTAARPLTHQVKPDSRTIPGVILADIWMRARTAFGGRAI